MYLFSQQANGDVACCEAETEFIFFGLKVSIFVNLSNISEILDFMKESAGLQSLFSRLLMEPVGLNVNKYRLLSRAPSAELSLKCPEKATVQSKGFFNN